MLYQLSYGPKRVCHPHSFATRAADRLRRLTHELKARTDLRLLERSIGQVVDRLLPREIALLRRVLTAPTRIHRLQGERSREGYSARPRRGRGAVVLSMPRPRILHLVSELDNSPVGTVRVSQDKVHLFRIGHIDKREMSSIGRDCAI